MNEWNNEWINDGWMNRWMNDGLMSGVKDWVNE